MNSLTAVDQHNSIARLQQLADVPAAAGFRGFLQGMSAPWLGLKVMWLRPHLWKYAVVPTLINMGITVVALLAMLVMATGFVGLTHWWVSGWQGYWFWVGVGVEILGALLMVMVCIAAAVITWRLLSGLLCGYFYGRLASQMEIDLGLPAAEQRELSLRYEFRDTAVDLFWLLISLAVSLVVGLIPIIGPPVALAYSLYYQVLSCGRDKLAFPLALRAVRRADRIVFCREH
ncbi:MAG: EI24 domain-containing protein, partial [Planctomycetales bacterium]|nr:EI24 domain-containing protein [Planctomycetales bacterium]